tara:strand:- start:835 stop:1329 length:495 start_codon:yes stop_codon:yes gene_type:complete
MGYKHIGKKVETSDLRLDKKVFFEKNKPVIGLKRLVVNTAGEIVNELLARRHAVLPDDNTAIDTSAFNFGNLIITPTVNRTKQLPEAKTGFIDDVLDPNGESLGAASYQAYEFSVINLSASHTITLSTNTGITLYGNMTVAVSSSGRFQAIKSGASAVNFYRIA